MKGGSRPEGRRKGETRGARKEEAEEEEGGKKSHEHHLRVCWIKPLELGPRAIDYLELVRAFIEQESVSVTDATSEASIRC